VYYDVLYIVLDYNVCETISYGKWVLMQTKYTLFCKYVFWKIKPLKTFFFKFGIKLSLYYTPNTEMPSSLLG